MEQISTRFRIARKMLMRLAAIAAALAFAATSACTSHPTSTTTPQTTPTATTTTPGTPPATTSTTPVTPATPAGPPTLSIASPVTGTVVIVPDVTVAIDVANFSLVDRIGQPNAPGEGHVIYYIDTDAPTTAEQPALTAAGSYAVTADKSYTWPNLPDGVHSLSVELVNNDNTPLSPPVVIKVSVSVFTG